MDKYVDLAAYDEEGEPRCSLLFPPGLEKLGSDDDRLLPPIRRFAKQVKPTPDGLFVLMNALGASEYWGQNGRGDRFYEKDLNHAPPNWDELSPEEMARTGKGWSYGYPTYLNARFFLHHRNKKEAPHFGEVLISAWNDEMKRVELLVFLIRKLCEQDPKAWETYKLASENQPFPVSMGVHVPYDICSACNHRAKLAADYCDCLKYQRGEILPNGVQVGMINPQPSFFDISRVGRGADKTAWSLRKIASEPKIAGQKRAEIRKEIPGPMEQGLHRLESYEKRLPLEVIEELAEAPLSQALSSLAVCGIVLRPEEFQHLLLTNAGLEKTAQELESRGVLFPETEEVEPLTLGREHADDRLVHLLQASGMLPARSILGPSLQRRWSLSQRLPASEKNEPLREETSLLQKISAAYNGYRMGFLETMNEIPLFLSSHPAPAAEVLGLSLSAPTGREKTANLFVPETFAYLTGAHYHQAPSILKEAAQRAKARMGYGWS
jgi:hypothetical protein